MINYSQAQKKSTSEGISEEIIEKDYLIELLLYYIARDEYLQKHLVFRGGTALKKMYFKDYRYSEDLDFITRLTNTNEFENLINTLLNRISTDYPLNFSIRDSSIVERDRCQLFIVYNIIEEIVFTKELKIDICIDNNIPSFRNSSIAFTHQEFKGNSSLLTYRLESVVSDKIGRILGVVNEARDIYDIWYLLKLDINIESIRKEFKNKYGYNIIIPNLISKISSEEYKLTWNSRLEKQINNLPDFNKVFNELELLINTKLNNFDND